MKIGSRAHKDREEGVQGDHREVLHSPHEGFPHQQEGLRGRGDYSQQKITQQDSRVSCMVFVNDTVYVLINAPLPVGMSLV